MTLRRLTNTLPEQVNPTYGKQAEIVPEAACCLLGVCFLTQELCDATRGNTEVLSRSERPPKDATVHRGSAVGQPGT